MISSIRQIKHVRAYLHRQRLAYSRLTKNKFLFTRNKMCTCLQCSDEWVQGSTLQIIWNIYWLKISNVATESTPNVQSSRSTLLFTSNPSTKSKLPIDLNSKNKNYAQWQQEENIKELICQNQCPWIVVKWNNIFFSFFYGLNQNLSAELYWH